MRAIGIIIGVGWIVFWAYWLVLAFTVKAEQARWTRFAGVRVGLVLVVLLLIRLRVFKGHGGATGNPWLLGIGPAFFVLGLALAVWARVYLSRNWGMPMSRRADPELVTTGPYGRIRHPIYSGVILGMVGTAIAVSPYWLNAVAILGAYFLFSARHRGTHHGQALPRRLPALQARHEDAHPVHPLTASAKPNALPAPVPTSGWHRTRRPLALPRRGHRQLGDGSQCLAEGGLTSRQRLGRPPRNRHANGTAKSHSGALVSPGGPLAR